MRLQRGVPVAGMDAELARSIARACAGREPYLEGIAHRVKQPIDDVRPLIQRLVSESYLQRIEHTEDDSTYTTTIRGGALAMASFSKPIKRAKAEELLGGVLERARNYNADETKPLVIKRIRVFGSYLHSETTELGDLDLAIELEPRSNWDQRSTLSYADASGRTFGSFIDRLFWPSTEAKQILRNRSAYVNLHEEDITRFTDSWKVVYSSDEASKK